MLQAWRGHRPLPPRARAALGKEVVDTYYAEEAKKVLEPVMVTYELVKS